MSALPAGWNRRTGLPQSRPLERTEHRGNGRGMAMAATLRSRLRTMSTASLEIQNATSAVMVGLLLALPFEQSTFLSAPGYRMFVQSGIPEQVWGLIFLSLGLLQMMAAYRDTVLLRRISAALLACLFGVYVTAFAIGNPVSAAIPFVLPMVVGQVWAFVRVRRVA